MMLIMMLLGFAIALLTFIFQISRVDPAAQPVDTTAVPKSWVGRFTRRFPRYSGRSLITALALGFLLIVQVIQLVIQLKRDDERVERERQLSSEVSQLGKDLQKAREGETAARRDLMDKISSGNESIKSSLPGKPPPFEATVYEGTHGVDMTYYAKNGEATGGVFSTDTLVTDVRDFLDGGRSYISKTEQTMGFRKYDVKRDPNHGYEVQEGSTIHYCLTWTSAKKPKIAFVIGSTIRILDVQGDGVANGSFLVSKSNSRYPEWLQVSIYTNEPLSDWRIEIRQERHYP